MDNLKKEIEKDITQHLINMVGDDYAYSILHQEDSMSEETFLETVTNEVLSCGNMICRNHYIDEDIKAAIGRELVARLGTE